MVKSHHASWPERKREPFEKNFYDAYDDPLQYEILFDFGMIRPARCRRNIWHEMRGV
jgi:hypothetical protein